MARDLKKETEWRKNKYKRLVVDVDKEVAGIRNGSVISYS